MRKVEPTPAVTPSDAHDPAQREPNRLAAIVKAQQAIATAGLDLEMVMGSVVEQVRGLTGAAGVVVELVEGEEMLYRAASGIAAPHLGLRLRVDASMSGLCARTGEILRCDDCEHDERVDREACLRVGARSLVVAPLPARERVLGALKVYSPEPNAFGEEDVNSLQLIGALLAAAIDDAQRFEATEALLKAERALRESEERYRSLFEHANEGFLLIERTPEGGYVYDDMNQSMVRILGIEREDFVGRSPAEALPADTATRVSALYEQVFGSGETREVFHREDLPLGQVTLHTHYHPIMDAGGRVHRILAISEDVTDRVRAEETSQQSDDRLRAVFEGAPIGVAIVGLDGHPVDVSPMLERQLGYTAAELRGMSFAEFTHPDDVAADWTLFEELMAGQRTQYQIEKRYYRKDGSLLWGNLSVALLRVPEGRPPYAIAMLADITERRRTERLLTEQRVELERSNRELQDFAHVASHDLQEPLRKIQAFGDRLRSRHADALGEQGQDYLERMQNAAGRMQSLIHDLLSYSRVTSNAQPFVPVPFFQVASEVMQDLQTQIERTAGRVEIGALPTVDADPVQMRQLLQNLISNALKFHREGVPPEVRVSSEVHGDTAELRIADNGIGFEEQYVDRIFRPFERLHGRNEYEGTGMGLAICRKIARRHGGEITARSAPGEGTTFVITLSLSHATDGGAA